MSLYGSIRYHNAYIVSTSLYFIKWNHSDNTFDAELILKWYHFDITSDITSDIKWYHSDITLPCIEKLHVISLWYHFQCAHVISLWHHIISHLSQLTSVHMIDSRISHLKSVFTVITLFYITSEITLISLEGFWQEHMW